MSEETEVFKFPLIKKTIEAWLSDFKDGDKFTLIRGTDGNCEVILLQSDDRKNFYLFTEHFNND